MNIEPQTANNGHSELREESLRDLPAGGTACPPRRANFTSFGMKQFADFNKKMRLPWINWMFARQFG
jgi:hypothetical protein